MLHFHWKKKKLVDFFVELLRRVNQRPFLFLTFKSVWENTTQVNGVEIHPLNLAPNSLKLTCLYLTYKNSDKAKRPSLKLKSLTD